MSFRVGFPEHCSGDERHDSIISISFIHPITTCGWRIHSVFPTLPIYICVTIIVAKKCLYTYVCMLDILSIYIYIMGGNDQYLISLTFFGQGLETSDR